MRETKDDETCLLKNLHVERHQQGLKNLENNVCWSVWNGHSIRLGLDPWAPDAPNFVPRVNHAYSNWISRPVSDLQLLDTG